MLKSSSRDDFKLDEDIRSYEIASYLFTSLRLENSLAKAYCVFIGIMVIFFLTTEYQSKCLASSGINAY